MTNYKNGKIYKITSGDKLYIGSTTQSLSQRLGGHKSSKKHGGHCSSFEIINNTDCQITLIELYPCNSREELLARERYHIDKNPQCINKCVPILSNEERSQKYPKSQAEREIFKQIADNGYLINMAGAEAKELIRIRYNEIIGKI